MRSSKVIRAHENDDYRKVNEAALNNILHTYSTCATVGGTPALITNNGIQTFLSDTISGNTELASSTFWVGLEYLSDEQRWAYTDQARTSLQDGYNEWASGEEPENAAPPKACVLLLPERGHRWGIRDCGKPKLGICQIPASTTPPQPVATFPPGCAGSPELAASADYNGICYIFSARPTDYRSYLKTDCQQFNATPVLVTNNQIHQFLVSQLELHPQFDDKHFWIGLIHHPEHQHWIYAEESLTPLPDDFGEWAADQNVTHVSVPYNCVTMSSHHNYSWVLENCRATTPHYICQIAPSTTIAPTTTRMSTLISCAGSPVLAASADYNGTCYIFSARPTDYRSSVDYNCPNYYKNVIFDHSNFTDNSFAACSYLPSSSVDYNCPNYYKNVIFDHSNFTDNSFAARSYLPSRMHKSNIVETIYSPGCARAPELAASADYNGICYIFSARPTDYRSYLKTDCQQFNATPVLVTNNQIHQFLVSQLELYPQFDDKHFWIGLIHHPEHQHWIYAEESLTPLPDDFDEWAADQNVTHVSVPYNCVTMSSHHNYSWVLENCRATTPHYICQIGPMTTTAPITTRMTTSTTALTSSLTPLITIETTAPLITIETTAPLTTTETTVPFTTIDTTALLSATGTETTAIPTTIETMPSSTTIETTPPPTTIESTALTTDVEARTSPPTIETTVPPTTIETTVPPTSKETTALPTNKDTTGPTTTVDGTSLLTTTETIDPPTTVETTSPPTSKETTVPPTNIETTVPPTTMETTAPPNTIETKAPSTTVEATSVRTTVETTAPPTTVETTAPPTSKETTVPPTSIETTVLFTTMDTTAPPTTIGTTTPPTTIETSASPTSVEATASLSTIETTAPPTTIETTGPPPTVETTSQATSTINHLTTDYDRDYSPTNHYQDISYPHFSPDYSSSNNQNHYKEHNTVSKFLPYAVGSDNIFKPVSYTIDDNENSYSFPNITGDNNV
ncbi:Hypp2653 [Branchiostoma lanceolatum]|uniref:Hypp2653 protein n=1 Tax=Branchiostoma lanceolatum TaxID=7740 RepID=A0A8J9ZY53_BRALA|nr:Hypp2653 [Branchiostoma lanceolatum]